MCKQSKRYAGLVFRHVCFVFGHLGPGQTAANVGCLTKKEQRPELESRSHHTCGESENSNFISSVKW